MRPVLTLLLLVSCTPLLAGGDYTASLELRGMYRYMADAASFEECRSRTRYPVAMVADNLALERAYLEERREPGQALMVHLEARIVERPAMEGDRQIEWLIPERFISITPLENCGQQYADAPLENSYWKLTRLNGHPVRLENWVREPHVRIGVNGGRMVGHDGCTAFVGAYQLDGTALRFSDIGPESSSCPRSELVQALERVREWHIIGDHLELLGPDGETVARLQSILF